MTIKELPRIRITEDEKIWLLECWNHLRNHNSIETYKHVKFKTLNSVSKGFEPWSIDNKLLRDNVEITLNGVIALNLEEEVFEIGNKVFKFIKNELYEDVEKSDFDLNLIADVIDKQRQIVKIVFKLFSNEGISLWNSAGSKTTGFGYDHIGINDSSFDTYMNYDSMLEAYLSVQKKRLEYENKHKLKNANSKLKGKKNFNYVSTDTLFPLELLENTRGYILNLGEQASRCYELKLYDASLVMIRKLIETLIIECFEHNAISDKIKNQDGHFFYLSDLIDFFIKETQWSLSRNTIKSLPQIKKYGDLSAHNRRFSAKKSDIDSIRIDLRIVIEELIYLIDYSNTKMN